MKRFGIFPKVFVYTTLFLAAVIAITIGVFYQQFTDFYNAQQMRRLRMDYQRLYNELLETGRDREQMVEIAQRFADRNQTFNFRIMDEAEDMLFLARERLGDGSLRENRIIFALGGYTLVAENPAPTLDIRGLLPRLAFAFASVMLITLAGAAVFARQMTIPIKRLAADTQKMTKLMPIDPPAYRYDEIGDLSRDVHDMYDKLKGTIEMRKYFFSAASHELKTPVAAARVVLEGMLAGVGDYGNHPKYLNECIKLMDEQGKTIHEILEIVNLDGHYIPSREEINIRETVAALLKAYKPMAFAKGHDITLEISEDLSCYTDAKLLKKALSNILLNAIQNTDKDGKIHIYSEFGKLCVINSGHIDEEHLPHLFDPFYRMDKARSRKSGQTGLGLTIVKKALDILGLDFGLENTNGGVLFWMTLPENRGE